MRTRNRSLHPSPRAWLAWAAACVTGTSASCRDRGGSWLGCRTGVGSGHTHRVLSCRTDRKGWGGASPVSWGGHGPPPLGRLPAAPLPPSSLSPHFRPPSWPRVPCGFVFGSSFRARGQLAGWQGLVLAVHKNGGFLPWAPWGGGGPGPPGCRRCLGPWSAHSPPRR